MIFSICICILGIFIYMSYNDTNFQIPKESIIKRMNENPNLIPLSDFFEAYFQCRRHKRSTPNARKFEMNYEDNLIQLWYEVNTYNYDIGKSICFLVKRPKLREVFAADFRDRIIHHIIMMRLEPLFENIFIEDTYNCRKGKGTLYGINRLYEKVREVSENYTKECYIGKFDLKGFFMSIHKPTLWIKLRDFINFEYKGEDKKLLLYLVKKIIFHHPEKNCEIKTPFSEWKKLPKNKSLFTCGKDRGLAIGNLTSQCFANFYMHFFDDFMHSMFKYYGRYVDDFYVISTDKEEIKRSIPKIRTFLKKELKVTLHPDKIYIQSYEHGIKFTGSVIKGQRRYIGNSTVAGFYNKIRIYNENINLKLSDKFVSTLNSYFGFFKHYECFGIKYDLISKINKKWFKFINIINFSKAKIRYMIKPRKIIEKKLKTKEGINVFYNIEDKTETEKYFISPTIFNKVHFLPDISDLFGIKKGNDILVDCRQAYYYKNVDSILDA